MNTFFEKYKNIPVQIKASIWFVICSVLQKAIAFLTTPIFTRLMTTEQYGQVTIYNSWVEVFMIFATLDIFYGVYNNALTKYPDDRARVTSSLQGLCTTLTLGLLVIYLLIHNLVNKWTGMSTNMTLFLFGELLFVPAFRFWSAKERYEYKYRKLVIISVLMAVLAPILGIPAVILLEQKGYAKIVTSVLAQVIFAFGLYISNFKKGKAFFAKDYWKYALAFNLPLIPHYLSSTILNQCDRIMIDRMCGTDKAGIYGLAYTVGALVALELGVASSHGVGSFQQVVTEETVAGLDHVCALSLEAAGLVLSPNKTGILGDGRLRLEAVNIPDLGNDSGGVDGANARDGGQRVGDDLELLVNSFLQGLDLYFHSPHGGDGGRHCLLNRVVDRFGKAVRAPGGSTNLFCYSFGIGKPSPTGFRKVRRQLFQRRIGQVIDRFKVADEIKHGSAGVLKVRILRQL